MNNIDTIENFVSFLEKEGIKYGKDVSMKENTTFKTGGTAKIMIVPENAHHISKTLKYFYENSLEFYILGNGSNILARDSEIPFPIIKISSELSNIKIIKNDDEYYYVKCEAGASLSKLAAFALENSLTGLEFFWGIPGLVGGAIYMNAGAYDGEMKDVIDSVCYIDQNGNEVIISNAQCEFSYRHSFFSDKRVCILSAVFKLKKGDKAKIKEKMDDFMQRRKSKQPLEYPSAGSTFKRPEGNYAGSLIEKCGLKGFAVGGACVSEKHAGFVINKSDATTEDILNLVEHIKKTVFEKTGYELECEIKVL